MRYDKLTIAIDFDGTLVEDEFPKIGRPTDGAYWLHMCQTESQARLILWTCRSGIYLDDAVEWCKAHNLQLFGVNENPLPLVVPCSVKAYADVYIDDRALGTPLIHRPGQKPFVDWARVGPTVRRLAHVARVDAERQG